MGELEDKRVEQLRPVLGVRRKPPPDLDLSPTNFESEFNNIISSLESEIRNIAHEDLDELEYSDSPSASIASHPTVPYPLDLPIIPSPTSSSYENTLPLSLQPFNNDYRLNRAPTAGSLKPTITTPITNLMTTPNTPDSLAHQDTVSRLDTMGVGPQDPISRQDPVGHQQPESRQAHLEPISHQDSMRSRPGAFKHRKSSSISSLISSGSNKNVNLAALKKTLVLRPGEAERSNYVLALRKSAGTAFNEAGPGKWKLPTGIKPVDTKLSSNGKYIRGGGISSNKKLSTGVELKHGHLAPRLLAAEVDDNDDKSIFSSEKTKKPPSIASKGSLSRTITVNSTNSHSRTPSQVSSTSTSSSGSSSSSSTSSSGSVNKEYGGFYQHPGYNEEEKILDESDEDAPAKLVLANPDSDSD